MDRGARHALPFGELDWLYVSVLFVTSRTVLLVQLDGGDSGGPKIWTAPTDRCNRTLDLRDCGVLALHSIVGIEITPRRLQLLDDCSVSLANFGGETRHVFFVAEWRETDGPIPAIMLSDGVADHRFFAADELPTMSIPYCRELIKTYFRHR